MLIFDFDGTIADTEDWHWFSWNDILKDYGVFLGSDDIKKYLSNNDLKIIEMIEKDFSINITDKEKFKNDRLRIFIENYLPKAAPYPYFVEIYNTTDVANICVVSNQRYDVIDRFFEIHGFKNIKIYSASSLNISKRELIKDIVSEYKDVSIYEDSNDYLKFGKSLGCKTFGIEHGYNRSTLIDADFIFRY